MMDTFKPLGQLYPSAGVDTTLYTVPGATRTVVSLIKACNQGVSETTFRLRIAIAGAVAEEKQYLFYDQPLQAKESVSCVEGIALAATDLVAVSSANGMVSFNVFGDEVT